MKLGGAHQNTNCSTAAIQFLLTSSAYIWWGKHVVILFPHINLHKGFVHVSPTSHLQNQLLFIQILTPKHTHLLMSSQFSYFFRTELLLITHSVSVFSFVCFSFCFFLFVCFFCCLICQIIFFKTESRKG